MPPPWKTGQPAAGDAAAMEGRHNRSRHHHGKQPQPPAMAAAVKNEPPPTPPPAHAGRPLAATTHPTTATKKANPAISLAGKTRPMDATANNALFFLV